MKTGIPVVGKIPNLPPTWMTESNGVWIDNTIQMADVIADICQTWLEDSLKPELYTEGAKTAEEFGNKEKFENGVIELITTFVNKRKEAFEAQIAE